MVQLFQAPPQHRYDPAIPHDKPVYRILSEKGFFGPDDTLHPEGALIVLYDVPNEDMEPMNDIARKAMSDYLDGLEESAKLVASANGRSFLGRPRNKEDMMANASEDARRLQTLTGGAGVPLMGGRKRGRPRIHRVGEEPVPDTGRKTGRGVEVLG